MAQNWITHERVRHLYDDSFALGNATTVYFVLNDVRPQRLFTVAMQPNSVIAGTADSVTTKLQGLTHEGGTWVDLVDPFFSAWATGNSDHKTTQFDPTAEPYVQYRIAVTSTEDQSGVTATVVVIPNIPSTQV